MNKKTGNAKAFLINGFMKKAEEAMLKGDFDAMADFLTYAMEIQFHPDGEDHAQQIIDEAKQEIANKQPA